MGTLLHFPPPAVDGQCPICGESGSFLLVGKHRGWGVCVKHQVVWEIPWFRFKFITQTLGFSVSNFSRLMDYELAEAFISKLEGGYPWTLLKKEGTVIQVDFRNSYR